MIPIKSDCGDEPQQTVTSVDSGGAIGILSQAVTPKIQVPVSILYADWLPAALFRQAGLDSRPLSRADLIARNVGLGSTSDIPNLAQNVRSWGKSGRGAEVVGTSVPSRGC